MEQTIIKPTRAKGEPQLPSIGILAVNPTDHHFFVNKLMTKEMKKYFLFNSNLHSDGKIFVAGPSVGAPMAALNLEKLIALGAEIIFLYGWCGSLTPDLQAMDLFVPSWAKSEEGTSSHYMVSGGGVPEGNKICQTQLKSWLISQGNQFGSGPIWTTDAPYRETYEKVEKYKREGIMAVDMEYSALCSVAAYRRVQFASLMFVSDELWRKPWRPMFKYKEFRVKSGEVLAGLCELLRNPNFMAL